MLQRWTMPIFPCEHCLDSAGHAKQMAKLYPLPLPAAAVPAGPVRPRRLRARHPPPWGPPRHRRQPHLQYWPRLCRRRQGRTYAILDRRSCGWKATQLLYTSTPPRAGDAVRCREDGLVKGSHQVENGGGSCSQLPMPWLATRQSVSDLALVGVVATSCC
jgi:hypothetical protein